MGLDQTHDLVVDDQPVTTVRVPVDAAQIDIEPGLRERLRQEGQQSLAIDGLTCGPHGALLGQHALAYTALGYLAVVLHRRLLWFDLPTQALHVLPLFLASHALQLTTRLIAGDGWPGWSLGLAPLLETLLWPLATLLLLAPQRRAHDPDENRPI